MEDEGGLAPLREIGIETAHHDYLDTMEMLNVEGVKGQKLMLCHQ